MPRMFYIALGAAVGVVTVRRAARAASTLTPAHMAGSLAQSVQDFVADVREGMAEREDELRQALGIGAGDGGDAGDAGAPGGTSDGRADVPDVADAHRR
ncbi:MULTISPECIES: hypothetical protein [unclassified Frankia]|uniref:hypothetical protein n=1 Tax=unclassified Frankia TaxID=2632575 RepID=UPI002AD4951F|nr:MULTISPECIES: hypothetical protein [unclassified Frankia]